MKIPSSLSDLDCAVRDVFILIGAFVIGAVIAAALMAGANGPRKGWEEAAANAAITAYQKQAVKQGFGTWEHDANGAPEFAWRGAKCSPLGVGK